MSHSNTYHCNIWLITPRCGTIYLTVVACWAYGSAALCSRLVSSSNYSWTCVFLECVVSYELVTWHRHHVLWPYVQHNHVPRCDVHCRHARWDQHIMGIIVLQCSSRHSLRDSCQLLNTDEQRTLKNMVPLHTHTHTHTHTHIQIKTASICSHRSV